MDDLKKWVFYAIFFLAFCFSGLITMLQVFPYRMAAISVFVLPLILVDRVKINAVLLVYIALIAEIGVSALHNKSHLSDFAVFTRILAFSYLMYYLTQKFVSQSNIVKIIRLCVRIAVIQLPVIVLQRMIYDYLPPRLREICSSVDFDFGTFNVKGDSSLGFFLILIVIFLLFNEKSGYIVRRKWVTLAWLTLTIMITNSSMAKLIVLLVWSVYLIVSLNLKTVLSMGFMFLVLIAGLTAFDVFEQIRGDLAAKFSRLEAATTGKQTDRYLSGAYSRKAAIYYYLERDILWVGDGPSAYSDVFAKKRFRGNTGHIFTFYSEVGILGWFLSVVIFFWIAFEGHKRWRITGHGANALMFISIQILSFTNQVMNDISVVLIYCIMVKSHMILVTHPVRTVRGRKLSNSVRGPSDFRIQPT